MNCATNTLNIQLHLIVCYQLNFFSIQKDERGPEFLSNIMSVE